MAFSRQHHPWPCAADSCFAPDQFSVWLLVDCQQPRGGSSATARAGEPGGPSNDEFPGNGSFFRRFVAHVTHHHSLLTLCGAHLYFWARLGYVLAAAAGSGLRRPVLSWN